MSDGEEMELREQSFTHFWNGYPQEQIQEEVAAVALVSPPGWERAVSQLLPRRFLPCFDAFRPGPTLPPLAGKPTAGSCRLSTKRMVHVSRDAGTPGVPSDGKPPRFCLECRCRACANP